MSEFDSTTSPTDAKAASSNAGDGAQPLRVTGLVEVTPESRARQKALATLQLDSRTYDRSLDCVHCGLCLPACPTYTQNGLEVDSPRGRIHLMKGLADGRIQPGEEVIKHLDLCLDCRACETACPSGVVYHELIEETRAKLESTKSRTLTSKLMRALFFHVFPYPTRLKIALLPARMLQRVGLWRWLTQGPLSKLMPAQFRKMQQMLPEHGAIWEKPLAAHYPRREEAGCENEPVARIAFFSGCVGSALFQAVNRQSVELLAHLGCDVWVPDNQTCCSAIHHHGGEHEKALQLARQNIDAFLTMNPKPDYIVNNIAGCGASLREYDHLLRDDPAYADKAKDFTARVRDISEVLVAIKPARPTQAVHEKVTYHDACHLAHAQKVTSPPREILTWIEGLQVEVLPESDMCCGAAGTYNLEQPDMAMQLGERKIRHIESTGSEICVTGNVGCAMQIDGEARRLGVKLQVIHPVTLLHRAYGLG